MSIVSKAKESLSMLHEIKAVLEDNTVLKCAADCKHRHPAEFKCRLKDITLNDIGMCLDFEPNDEQKTNKTTGKMV